MNRLGIFSLYDKDGILDEYAFYLLNSLKPVISRLIIVSNGNLNVHSKTRLLEYTNEIIERENLGFDAGAYKDVLLNYLNWDLNNYDELVLCNDTFYGPFIPFCQIFDSMNKKECDFWGLNYVHTNIANHIQSYFFCFKKNILKDKILQTFFTNYVDEKSTIITDISPSFEIGIFSYLVKEHRYKYDAFVKTSANIYGNVDECTIEHNLPILKKKALKNILYFEDNIMRLLKYLQTEKIYPVEYIINCTKRIYDIDISLNIIDKYVVNYSKIKETHIPFCNFSSDEVIAFCKKGIKAYIYGYTNWFSQIVYWSCCRLAGNFAGFVVSDNKNIDRKELFGYPIFHISEIKHIENKSIIVTLGGGGASCVKENFGMPKNFLYVSRL